MGVTILYLFVTWARKAGSDDLGTEVCWKALSDAEEMDGMKKKGVLCQMESW